MYMKGKKIKIIINVLGIIFILYGVFKIITPYFQVALDKKNISKNSNEWDEKRSELNMNKEESKSEGIDEKIKNNEDYKHITINDKDVIGKMIIEKEGIETPIILGATEENLRQGVTLYDNGIYPGDYGTAIILGHRETTFRCLEDIEIGDEIYIESVDNKYKFIVRNIYVTNPDDSSILEQQNNKSMTLVTCYPFQYLGNAPERFIVKLDLKE